MSNNIYRFIESEMMRLSFSEVTDLAYVSDTPQFEQKLKVLNKSLEQRVIDYTAKLVEVNVELTEEIEKSKRMEMELKSKIGKLNAGYASLGIPKL